MFQIKFNNKMKTPNFGFRPPFLFTFNEYEDNKRTYFKEN